MTTITFGHPVTSDLRADVLQYIRDYMDGQAKMFNGDTLVSLPTGTIRYVTANNRFEKWSGTAWESLNITGNVTPTPPGGSTTHVQFNDGGGNFGGDSDLTWDKTANQLQITGSARVNSAVCDYLVADGLSGYSIIAKLAIGGWARGMSVVKNSDASRIAAAGFYGNNEDTPLNFRIAFGSSFWDAAATEGLTVVPAGNIGVGKVTPSAWNSAYRAIEIGQVGNAIWAGNASDDLWLTANAYYDNTPGWKYATTGIAWAATVGGSDFFQVRRAASGTGGAALTWTTLFQVDSGGMISTFGTGNGLYVSSRDLDGQQWLLYSPDGEDLSIYNNTAGQAYIFGKNNAQFNKRMQIRKDSPTAYNDGQLELYSAAGDVLLGFHAGGASAVSIIHPRGTAVIEARSNPISGWADLKAGPVTANGASYTSDWFRNTSANTGIYSNYHGIGWQIQAGALVGYGTNICYVGELRSYGNVTAYYSDERLKRRVGGIDGALEQVRQISGFRYVQNMLGNKLMGYNPNVQLAVSAQEVQKIAPEVVALAPFDDDGEGNSISGENYLTVRYERLVPILIEAIKQLDLKVEHMREMIRG